MGTLNNSMVVVVRTVKRQIPNPHMLAASLIIEIPIMDCVQQG